MRNKIQQGKRQRNRVRARVLLLCAILSIFITIAGGILVFLNINSVSKLKASATGEAGGGNDMNNGEVISEFIWEKDPVTTATWH